MVFENEVNLYGDAPIASKFSSQDTKFDVIQGHINAIISESEMIELLDGGKTMYSGMNDIKIDVTGLHGNISSLSTTVDGQTQQITEINSKQATYEASLEEFSATLSDTQSDLETTSQNLATLQLDTNRFKTTVSNTYSTKTQAQGYATSAQNAAISSAADDATSKANAAEASANAATDNKLRNYSTTSSVSSMIDQKADEITTSVSRSYATKEEARTAAETTITGDTIYYLAYASNTGVNRQTSGWTPDPTASSAQISESKKYLWTYHLYTYGSGDTRPTDPIVTGTYGTQGATGDTGVGISKVTPLYYAKNNNTAPAKPTSKITTTTINTGVWTTALPSLTNTYKYLFTCDQIEYDDSSSHIEWTTVVENKNTAELYTRLTTAEQKITDSAIIQTVSASGQFPAKGEIILAINEVGQSVAKINANKLELSAYSTIEQTAQKLAEKNGSYIGDGAPTSSNYPASSWTSDAVKQSHIGDIYYDKADGFAYQYTGDSSGLLVKFNSNSRTEAVGYDYVRFYYKKGDITYTLDDIGGTIGAKEVFIPAKEFWVYWRTDSSAHDYYGFALDSVSVVRREIPQAATGTIPSYAVTDTSTITSIASPHNPYEDNTNKIWHFTYSGSISITKSYTWVRRKDNDIAQAEANITALGEQITSKVSKGDIASTINQTAQSVLIDAQKINLQGYLTISSAGNTYATKSDASSREQYVYYQSSSSSVPSTSDLSTWITSNSDTYNQWVTRRPTYRSSYSHIFICRQMQSVDGTVTFTSPVSDQTTTVIDGGSITTGVISADRVMGGTFKAGGSASGTSGKNGAIEIYNSSNSRLGRIDSSGIYFGNIASNLSNPNFKVDDYGYLTCKGATIATASDSLSCNMQLTTNRLSLRRNNAEIGYVGFNIDSSNNTYARLYGSVCAEIENGLGSYVSCSIDGNVILRAPVGKNVRVGYPGQTASNPIVVGESPFYLYISNNKLYIRNSVDGNVTYYATLTRA